MPLQCCRLRSQRPFGDCSTLSRQRTVAMMLISVWGLSGPNFNLERQGLIKLARALVRQPKAVHGHERGGVLGV